MNGSNEQQQLLLLCLQHFVKAASSTEDSLDRNPFIAFLRSSDGEGAAAKTGTKEALEEQQEEDTELLHDLPPSETLQVDLFTTSYNASISYWSLGRSREAFLLLRPFATSLTLLQSLPALLAIKCCLLFSEIATAIGELVLSEIVLDTADQLVQRELFVMQQPIVQRRPSLVRIDDPFVSPTSSTFDSSGSQVTSSIKRPLFQTLQANIMLFKARLCVIRNAEDAADVQLRRVQSIVADIVTESSSFTDSGVLVAYISSVRSYADFRKGNLAESLRGLQYHDVCSSRLLSQELEVCRYNNLGCLSLKSSKTELAKSFFLKAREICSKISEDLADAINKMENTEEEKTNLLELSGRVSRLCHVEEQIGLNLQICGEASTRHQRLRVRYE